MSNPTNTPDHRNHIDYPTAAEHMREACDRCGQRIAYQGWPNHATWAIALWIGNDQATDERAHALVAQAANITAAADALLEMVENESPLANQASLFTDLLNYAIASADWFELAMAYQPPLRISDYE